MIWNMVLYVLLNTAVDSLLSIVLVYYFADDDSDSSPPKRKKVCFSLISYVS